MVILDDQIFAAARVLNSLHTGTGRWLRFAAILLGTVGLLVVATLPLPFLNWPDYAAGIAFLLAVPATALLLLERYSHGVVNANTSFSEDAAKILSNSYDFSVFLRLLVDQPRVRYLLFKLGITPDLISKSQIKTRDQILVTAKELSGNRPVDLSDLLLLILLESPEAVRASEAQKLTKEDVVGLLAWERERETARRGNLDPYDPDHLVLSGGFAKDWASGYTLLLDKYSTDLSLLFSSRRNKLHIIGHQNIIEEIARNLGKSNKSNVILVGDPGVGKRTAVLGFAQQVVQGRTLKELSWKHVKMVDLGHLMAGASTEDIEVRLMTVLNESARAGNIILFLDNIETILGGAPVAGAQGERISGVVDAGAVLAKFLDSDRIQIIATSTYDAYHKSIERNPILVSQFEKIEVNEPSPVETTLITLDASVGVETEYKVLVSYGAVKEIVRLAERYLHDAPFPEKALDLLEEVAVYVSRQMKEKIVLPKDVQEIVHQKTSIPVAEATGGERDVLLNLEEKLHQRIVNQREAIRVVADALRRARAGLKEKNRPIGTFLFLGPTGVGKTETAKAVSESFFGSEAHMIRLDMNEFLQAESAGRFQEMLTTKAKEDPYTLILLDEVEKADRRVMNLLLRLLDEGKIADLSGKMVDMTNTIIVATSNAGAEQIREAIKGKTNFDEGYATLKATLLDYLQKERIFSPEFLNRFDAVVLFQPLNPEQVGQVVELMLNRLNRQLTEQGIQVKLDPAAVQRLATTGYDSVFGARALRRTLQEKVENVVARKILAGQLPRGSVVTLTAADL